jgi:hypothetical protein
LFGLIVILLLARRIKALLQKRSSLKVVRMINQEQKRSLLDARMILNDAKNESFFLLFSRSIVLMNWLSMMIFFM